MESNKPQIVHIHGGDSFDTDEEFFDFLRGLNFSQYTQERKTWRKWLEAELIDTHEFFAPQMPNSLNARYEAWAIWFEKLLPSLRDDVVLIGYSLGGGFLLRYLSEKKLPITISQLHLVAPVVDDLDCPGVGGFKINLDTWSDFQSDIKAVHLWHSSDDPYIPTHHSERFIAKYPAGILHRFTDRNHFFQPEFPELLAVIKDADKK